jgi:chitodextrinase
LAMAAIFGLIGLRTLWLSFAQDLNFSKGDFNRDYRVDGADLGILLGVFGQINASADTDEDGSVTAIDLSKVLSNQGTTINDPNVAIPSAPGGLHATSVSYTATNIAWSASTSASGIARYNIYRNGTFLTSTTFLSHTDSSLSQSTSYTYTVSAVDNTGHESAQSSVVSIVTNTPKVAGPVADGLTLDVNAYQFSAYHKARLGWLNPENGVNYMQTAQPSQTIYKIGQSETMTGDGFPKLIRVPHRTIPGKTIDYLYLDFRQPYGFDANLATEAVTGVSIRHAYGLTIAIKPYLLDFHNATTDYYDAPLQPGEQFTDVKTGITIKVLEVIRGQYATVQITGMTMVPDPPYGT